MQAQRFRSLVDTEGPFASVYVDDSHDTADAEKQAELRWRAVADELRAQGADDSLIADVRSGLDQTPPAVGRGGCAVITGGGIRLVQRLVRPPETPTARVSQLPYLVPAVVHGVDDRPHLLVVVDHEGAEVSVRSGGHDRVRTVEGGQYPVVLGHRRTYPFDMAFPGYGAGTTRILGTPCATNSIRPLRT